MSRYNLSAKSDKILFHLSDRKLAPKDAVLRTLGVAFGYDHMMGYFCDIYEPATAERSEVYHVELCSKFNGITHSQLLEVLHYYADEEELKKFETQLTQIVLDLPF